MKSHMTITSTLLMLSALVVPACVAEPAPEDEEAVLQDENLENEGDAEGMDENVGEAQQAIAYCEGWDPGLYQWCLTTCTGSGSHLWVVGTQTQVGGYGKCNQAAEWFCAWNGMGNRKNTCWGYWY